MGYSTVNSVTMTEAPTLLTGISQSHISSPLSPSSTAQHRPKPAMTDLKQKSMLLQLSSSLTKNDILVQGQVIDLWLWTVLHLTLSQPFVKYPGCYTRVPVKWLVKKERVNYDPIRILGG